MNNNNEVLRVTEAAKNNTKFTITEGKSTIMKDNNYEEPFRVIKQGSHIPRSPIISAPVWYEENLTESTPECSHAITSTPSPISTIDKNILRWKKVRKMEEMQYRYMRQHILVWFFCLIVLFSSLLVSWKLAVVCYKIERINSGIISIQETQDYHHWNDKVMEEYKELRAKRTALDDSTDNITSAFSRANKVVKILMVLGAHFTLGMSIYLVIRIPKKWFAMEKQIKLLRQKSTNGKTKK